MTHENAGIQVRLPAENRVGGRRLCAVLLTAGLCGLLLLFALPEARCGVMALCNALFDASEAANAYVYQRFPAPAGQSAGLAVALLGVIGLSIVGLCAVTRSRGLILCCAAVVALSQAYFGLSLPWWMNLALFLLAGLGWMKSPVSKRAALSAFGALLALSLAVFALCPGVRPEVERLSERARDWLGQAAGAVTALTPEEAEDALETRRVHDRAPLSGEQEASPRPSFRLVTAEQEQVSPPPWMDWLKAALLLLLTVAVLTLPFLPFLFLNARRKKAMALRAAFTSDDVRDAVCAIFRHAAAYLDAAGFGGGNRPYRAWPAAWPESLPEAYIAHYERTVALFEEAAYSNHPLGEAQRQQALDFLGETERLFFDEAPGRQRFLLRYKACLHA